MGILDKVSKGMTIKHLVQGALLNLIFPLPPHAVQNAIVAKLEEVLPLVEAYENAVLQKEELKTALPDKVKKAILQEAIQGKLTEDWRKTATIEETGKQLLDRIIEERNAKLLAEWEEAKKKNPKAKKPTPIVASEIPEEEIPFEIPESWCWCRLGDLIQIKSGDGLTSTQMKDGSIPVYGGNGITGYHNDANIHEETIVIGRVGFYCGSVHLTEKEAWVTDNAFISNYSKTYLNRNYLITALRQLDLGKQQNKTAQPVVSGKKIYPMLFPLPPLAEQKKIVEIIDQMLPLCEKLGG